VLGREAAQVFADRHRDQGVDLRSGVRVTEITVERPAKRGEVAHV
jgi:3-phenylpropionate/trans-cinnamate dioxygenase ferredoxin reductase subunit